MSKYHYEIIITNQGDEIASQILAPDTVLGYSTFYLDTNNRLSLDENITISTPRGALLNLKLTKITRYLFQIIDGNMLVEMDMNPGWNRDNRPTNRSDEVWFTCRANIYTLKGD